VCRKPDDDAAFRERLGEAGARVRLVGRAEDWLGASARERGAGAAWLGWVHAPMTDAEGEAVREQKSRMSPFPFPCGSAGQK
jgi:hypothetical protein